MEAAEIARRTGRRDRLLIAVGNVAYTGFLIGEWDEAIAQVDVLVDETSMDPGNRVWVLSNAIILHANRGDDVSACARRAGPGALPSSTNPSSRALPATPTPTWP